MNANGAATCVVEDESKLMMVEHGTRAVDIDMLVKGLREDLVTLVSGIDEKQADTTVNSVADRLGLRDSLELQAGYADFSGHLQRVGKYFMSVNNRNDYQFITPHSEGDSFVGMQLAAFLCYENNTDGGETMLMNVDSCSEAWSVLRERARRSRPLERPLPTSAISRARALYRINLPADTVQPDDQMLGEWQTDIPNLRL